MRDKNIQILILNTLKNFSEEIKGLEENKDNIFKVIASSEDIDRSGEIIKVNGWDDQNYKKNPVILSNHNYKIQDIVGKMTKIYKEGKKLIVEGIFTEKTEMGKMCKELYNTGFLKTVSVGFLPKKRDEENKNIIEEAELLEISFVAVPCNPNAVSLDKKILEKGFELGILKEIGEEKQNYFLEINKKIEKLEKKINFLEELQKENKKIFETLILIDEKNQEEINISKIAKKITKNIL